MYCLWVLAVFGRVVTKEKVGWKTVLIYDQIEGDIGNSSVAESATIGIGKFVNIIFPIVFQFFT